MIDTKPSQPHSPNPPGEWDQFTRQAAIVILLLGVLFLFRALRPLLNLLAVTGIFILILLYPVNKLRAKTRLAYPLVVFAVFIPLAVLLFLVFTNLAQWGLANTQSLVISLQQVKPTLDIDQLVAQLPGGIPSVRQLLLDLAALVGHQLSSVMKFITLIIISSFLAFLFILEMPANLAHSFRSLSGVSQREFGILFQHVSNVWNGWLRSTVITSAIVGLSTALELALFGIPYAWVLGLVAGLLNLVPTFGPLVAYLLIIVVTYSLGSTRLALDPVVLTLLVWAVNLVINQVVRLVIFPRLAGKAMHLPVFFVILGLVVAGVLWGVIGVILVVPLLGTVRETLNYVLHKINRQDPYPGEQPVGGFWTEELGGQ